MIEALAEWNEWWSSGKVDPELVGRKRKQSGNAEEFLSFREIKTIIGIRRSGKSTLIYQFIDYLLKKNGVDPSRILFVNFEDPILSKATLGEIIDSYQTHVNPDEKPYLFLDEVHRCKEWALFLRKLYDLRKIKQAFITDSSSRFIESEYASVITGREVNITVFPLSFYEYLSWNGIKLTPPYARDRINRIKSMLNSYLQWGGLPEVVLRTSETHKKVLLNDYLGDIVHKDIIERYNANYKKIKGLIDFLVANPGTLFSPRKYSRIYGLSLDAINTYSGYLEEVFLFFPVSKYDYSVRKQQLSPKKMYLCDTGFFGGTGFRFTENKGRTFENAVFIDLKRKGKEIYYWKGRGECDFVVKEGNKLSMAIQVCYDPGLTAKDREIKGLIEAMETLKIKEGLIITENVEQTEKIGRKSVRYIPLWKYLLSSNA
jgi:predicted AAA+ superfamily ATPase